MDYRVKYVEGKIVDVVEELRKTLYYCYYEELIIL